MQYLHPRCRDFQNKKGTSMPHQRITTSEYDTLDRLIKETVQITGTNENLRISQIAEFEYDTSGNVVKETLTLHG
jgi:YD repeat-containing protein